jgi:MoaA/NifB/PqqE/SkfB family radical SAM enzyme
MSGYFVQPLKYSRRLLRMKPKTSKLCHLTLNLTDRCNSRCRMCDIWRKRYKTDMPIKKIKAVLSDSLLKNIKSICLTGGEPFIRTDLPEIHSLIRQRFPACRIYISTNGLLKKETLDFLERAGTKNLTLHISIDGIVRHDYVRGVRGAFRKTTDNIREIRKAHPKLKLETKFTITPWNCNEILDVYNLSKKLKTEFRIKMIQNLKNYTNTIDYEKNKRLFSFTGEQKRIVSKQLRALSKLLTKEGKLIDVFFVNLIIQYLRSGNFRLKYCNCTFNSIFIMPNGNSYLCRYMNSIGNVYSSGLSGLWKSDKAEHIRNTVRAGRCPPCISLYGFYN